MTDPARTFDVTADGLRLRVRLTPGASRGSVDGLTELPDGRWAVRLRVPAKPVDGAANDALITFLARALGRPRSCVRLASGRTSRIKSVEVSGDPADLSARIADWIGAGR